MKLLVVCIIVLSNFFNCSSVSSQNDQCVYDVDNVFINNVKLLQLTKKEVVKNFGTLDSTIKHFDEMVDDLPHYEYFFGKNTFLFKGDYLIEFNIKNSDVDIIGFKVGDSINKLIKEIPCSLKLKENSSDQTVVVSLQNEGKLTDAYIGFIIKDSVISEIYYKMELI